MNLTDLASFVRVVELGTITAASKEEQVPKSTISRRIARLEQDLGVELLRRSPRSFTLTDDGKTLHARTRGALYELEHVEQALLESSDVPHGRLVLSAPPDLGRTAIFAELLFVFQQRYPKVKLEVGLEMRMVDLLLEGVDVAFRMHNGQIPGGDGLMSKLVGRGLIMLFASPCYLEKRGVPTTFDELYDHDWITHVAFADRVLELEGHEEVISFSCPEGVCLVNDFVLMQALLEAGSGLGFLPQFLAENSVSSGSLVPVMPEVAAKAGACSLVWPESRHLAPRIRAFVDVAYEVMMQHLF